MSLSKYFTGHLQSDIANILGVVLLVTLHSCLPCFCRSFNPLNIPRGTSTRAVDELQVFYPQLMMFLASPSAKLLTNDIKFMLNYSIVLVCKWFGQIRNLRNTFNSCDTTLKCWSASGLDRFEPFETHQIHVKVPYSSGLVVVQTDLKLLKHIEVMLRWQGTPYFQYWLQKFAQTAILSLSGGYKEEEKEGVGNSHQILLTACRRH